YTCLLFCTIHRFNDSGENAPVLLSLSYWYNSMRKRLNTAARDTMRRHSIMIDQYLNEISHLIAHITKKEKNSMAKTTSKLADTIQQEGDIHIFGSDQLHV